MQNKKFCMSIISFFLLSYPFLVGFFVCATTLRACLLPPSLVWTWLGLFVWPCLFCFVHMHAFLRITYYLL